MPMKSSTVASANLAVPTGVFEEYLLAIKATLLSANFGSSTLHLQVGYIDAIIISQTASPHTLASYYRN